MIGTVIFDDDCFIYFKKYSSINSIPSIMIQGLCSSNPCGVEFLVLRGVHLLIFWIKKCVERKRAPSPDFIAQHNIYIYTCTLYPYMSRFRIDLWATGSPGPASRPDPWDHIQVPHMQCVRIHTHTPVHTPTPVTRKKIRLQFILLSKIITHTRNKCSACHYSCCCC